MEKREKLTYKDEGYLEALDDVLALIDKTIK